MAAMNKIQDKLFLGNIKSASDLKLLKANVSIEIEQTKVYKNHRYNFLLHLFWL